MRPIDADELLKEINDIYNGYILSEQFAPTDFAGMVEEAKTVEAAPAEKWIPVTERLPEEHGGYLVSLKQGYVTTAFWSGNSQKWEKITAWMPLPEPYKGGE